MTIAELVAEIVVQLVASRRLPLDVRELADTLENEYDAVLQESLDEFKYTLGNNLLQRNTYRLRYLSA